MADHITLTITGLKEAAIALGRWSTEVEAQARQLLAQEIEFGVQDVQRVTPIGKTGNLVAGVSGRVEGIGVTGTVRNRASHAHLVEWGHKIVTHKKQDTGKRVDRHTPSVFVVPMMARRAKFYGKLKRLIGQPLPGLDVTPEVRDV